MVTLGGYSYGDMGYAEDQMPDDRLYCVLCDEYPDATSGPLVETSWGPMHRECAESHEPEELERACGWGAADGWRQANRDALAELSYESPSDGL